LAPLPGKGLILNYVIKITINPCSSRITLVCLLLYLMQGNKWPIYDLLEWPHKIRRIITNSMLEKEVDVCRWKLVGSLPWGIPTVDGAQATNSMVTQDTDKVFIQVRPPCGRNTYVLRLIVLLWIVLSWDDLSLVGTDPVLEFVLVALSSDRTRMDTMLM